MSSILKRRIDERQAFVDLGPYLGPRKSQRLSAIRARATPPHGRHHIAAMSTEGGAAGRYAITTCLGAPYDVVIGPLTAGVRLGPQVLSVTGF